MVEILFLLAGESCFARHYAGRSWTRR